MSSQPRLINDGGVHRRLGYLQRELTAYYSTTGLMNITTPARIPLPLHLAMVEDPPGLPARQPRLGVPEVRSVKRQRTFESKRNYWRESVCAGSAVAATRSCAMATIPRGCVKDMICFIFWRSGYSFAMKSSKADRFFQFPS